MQKRVYFKKKAQNLKGKIMEKYFYKKNRDL